jgi:DNA-binding response OmpR family regulator
VRLLVVEDDDRVSKALGDALLLRGVPTTRVARGADALAYLSEVDAVVLDLSLPDVEGLDVCRQIRQVCAMPIVMATARGDVADRILGLDAGADDYLVKPYDVGELLARLHAILRRRQIVDRTVPCHDVGEFRFDDVKGRVTHRGREISLSPKELQLLMVIAESRGAVCTRRRMVARVWGRWWSGADDTLNVHIASLRTKLGQPDLVRTVRGVGFRLADAEDGAR